MDNQILINSPKANSKPIKDWFEDVFDHLKMGRRGIAKKILKQIVEKKNEENTLLSLASALYKSQFYDLAERYIRREIRRHPNSHYAYFLLGMIIMERCEGDSKPAWNSFQSAVKLKPNCARYIVISAHLLSLLSRYDEAKAFLLLHLKSHHLDDQIEILLKLVVLAIEQNKLDEGLEWVEKVLAQSPDKVEALINRGFIQLKLGCYKLALADFQKVAEIYPEEWDNQVNLALCLLSVGRFREGWEVYEWRLKMMGTSDQLPRITRPLWQGEALEDTRLAIFPEQGLGDHIYFSQMLHILRVRLGSPVIFCTKRMRKIFERSFPWAEWVEYELKNNKWQDSENFFLARGGKWKAITMGSLPRISQLYCEYENGDSAIEKQIAETIQSTLGLLTDNANVKRHRDQLEARLGKGARFVGLSWQTSNTVSANWRTIAPELWHPILSIKGLAFIDLQYPLGQEEMRTEVEKLGGIYFTPDWVDPVANPVDFMDFIKAIDFVVTIANATGHMTGSVKQSGVVLAHMQPHLYWQAEVEYPLIYPSLNVLKQKTLYQWDELMAEAAAIVHDYFFSENKQLLTESDLQEHLRQFKAENDKMTDKELNREVIIFLQKINAQYDLTAEALSNIKGLIGFYQISAGQDLDIAYANLGYYYNAGGRSYDILSAFAIALDKKGQCKNAEAIFKACSEVMPNDQNCWMNLSLCYENQKKYDLAIDAIDHAITLSSQRVSYYISKLRILFKMKADEQTIISYLKDSCKKIPDHHDFRFRLSELQLTDGDYKSGFKNYEARLYIDTAKPTQMGEDDWPRWQKGEDIKDKRLLVHYEQGFGDVLQFSRLVIRLKKLAAKVIFWIPSALYRLYLFNSIDNDIWVDIEIITSKPKRDRFDCSIDLLSLPHMFNGDKRVLGSYKKSYLLASSDENQLWFDRWKGEKGLRVGLLWSGSKLFPRDNQRSMSLDSFLPLINSFPDIQFKSFQRECPDVGRYPENLEDVGKNITDFFNSASAMMNCDLLISIDTGPLHMAGALGIPAWVLLKKHGSWRWGRGNDKFWYSSVEIMREEREDSWDDLIQETITKLAEWGKVRISNRLQRQQIYDKFLNPKIYSNSKNFTVLSDLLFKQNLNIVDYYTISKIASECKKHEVNKQCIKKIIELQPTNIKGISKLASNCIYHGELEKCFAYAEQAIQRNPQNIINYLDKMNYEITMGYYDEAQVTINRADQVHHKHSQLLYFKGLLNYRLPNHAEALKWFNEKLAVDEGDIQTIFRRSMCHLGLGMVREGLADYEIRVRNRWVTRSFYAEYPTHPLWEGEDMKDGHLLILLEGGLGDQILHLGFIDPACAKQITITVAQRLVKLIQRTFPEYKVESFDLKAHQEGEYERQVFGGSLAYHLVERKNVTEIPAPDYAWLKPDKIMANNIRKDLQDRFPSKKLIGFSWASKHANAGNRYLQLSSVSFLKNYKDIVLINLQYGAERDQFEPWIKANSMAGYTHPDIDPKGDIDDLAALIFALDGVVTLDNLNLHLAGALGIPTIGLVSRIPSAWYWHITEPNPTHYPWAPSVKLLRQKERNDWTNVFKDLSIAIKSYFRDKDILKGREFKGGGLKKKLKSKKILIHSQIDIHSDTGIGDIIRLSRFLPLFKKHVAQLAFVVPPSLHKLYAINSSNNDLWVGIDIYQSMPNWTAFDMVLSLDELMTKDLIPDYNLLISEMPLSYLIDYYIPLSHGIYKQGQVKKEGLNIGLWWFSNEQYKNNPEEAIGVAEFLPLINRFPEINFRGFQNDLYNFSADLPSHLIPTIGDMSNILLQTSILVNCDLVISPNSDHLYLAAALGIPVWGLSDNHDDWNDVNDGNSSLRVFRKQSNWQDLIFEVSAALSLWFETHHDHKLEKQQLLEEVIEGDCLNENTGLSKIGTLLDRGDWSIVELSLLADKLNEAAMYDYVTQVYERLQKKQPHNIIYMLDVALNNNNKGEYKKSFELAEQAIKRNPNRINSYLNKIDFEISAEEYVKAQQTVLRAEKINKDYFRLIFLKSLIQFKLCNYQKSLEYFNQVLSLMKKDGKESDEYYFRSIFTRSDCYLSLGQWRDGLEDYEVRVQNRWLSSTFLAEYPMRPMWDGRDLKDGHLLVLYEGGLGDQLLHLAFVDPTCAAQITITVDARLVKFLSRKFPQYSIQGFDVHKHDNPCYDMQVFGGSLLYHLAKRKSLTEIPYPNGIWLKPNVDKVIMIRRELKNRYPNKKLVGFSWASHHAKIGNRYLDLDQFNFMQKCKDIVLINLQYWIYRDDFDPWVEANDMQGYSYPDIDPMDDIDDFAALVSALDGVITLDSFNLHLAGGLGVPTIALVTHVPDAWYWRAMEQEPDRYRWSSQVMILKQKKRNDWSSVFKRLPQAIEQKFGQDYDQQYQQRLSSYHESDML